MCLTSAVHLHELHTTNWTTLYTNIRPRSSAHVFSPDLTDFSLTIPLHIRISKPTIHKPVLKKPNTQMEFSAPAFNFRQPRPFSPDRAIVVFVSPKSILFSVLLASFPFDVCISIHPSIHTYIFSILQFPVFSLQLGRHGWHVPR